jgi:hypothetical protein
MPVDDQLLAVFHSPLKPIERCAFAEQERWSM